MSIRGRAVRYNWDVLISVDAGRLEGRRGGAEGWLVIEVFSQRFEGLESEWISYQR